MSAHPDFGGVSDPSGGSGSASNDGEIATKFAAVGEQRVRSIANKWAAQVLPSIEIPDLIGIINEDMEMDMPTLMGILQRAESTAISNDKDSADASPTTIGSPRGE